MPAKRKKPTPRPAPSAPPAAAAAAAAAAPVDEEKQLAPALRLLSANNQVNRSLHTFFEVFPYVSEADPVRAREVLDVLDDALRLAMGSVARLSVALDVQEEMRIAKATAASAASAAPSAGLPINEPASPPRPPSREY